MSDPIGVIEAYDRLGKLAVLRVDHVGLEIPYNAEEHGPSEATVFVTWLRALIGWGLEPMGLKWAYPSEAESFVYVVPGKLGLEIYEYRDGSQVGFHVDFRVADSPERIREVFPEAFAISLKDGQTLYWVVVDWFAGVEFGIGIRQERTAVGVEESVTTLLTQHAARAAVPPGFEW